MEQEIESGVCIFGQIWPQKGQKTYTILHALHNLDRKLKRLDTFLAKNGQKPLFHPSPSFTIL
jgi:hypothetical protein